MHPLDDRERIKEEAAKVVASIPPIDRSYEEDDQFLQERNALAVLGEAVRIVGNRARVKVEPTLKLLAAAYAFGAANDLAMSMPDSVERFYALQFVRLAEDHVGGNKEREA